MANEQLSFLPPSGDAGLPAGWQLHPSTRTAHYFGTAQRAALCKRERRTTGPVVAEPGVFPCTLCSRRLPHVP